MRALFPVLALLCAATTAASAATDDEIRQKIVGVWGESPACAQGRLAFNADSSFSSRNTDAASNVEGTYDITSGKLNGKVGAEAMPEMIVAFDNETLLLASGGGDPDRLVRCATQ